jgi:hypothetical protein
VRSSRELLRNKSLVGGLGCFLFALAYFWEAYGLPIGSMARPGIGYVPNLLGKIALLLSAAIMVAAWFEKAKETAGESDAAAEAGGGSGPWVIAVLLVAYPFALDTLGFFLATIPFFFVSLIVMGHRNKITGVVISAAVVLVSYYLFSVLAGVRFPAGLFE